ncbi:MAG: RNase adaptor protein RapZ, partial [Clostridia bacterium]|nr:RNase adaptor protein RapZ [Clostridia bacterium]
MEIVIVTGMSGSGKTRASMILEDAGYYCISNLPSTMLLQFVNIYSSAERHSEKVAFIIDVRSEENFPRLSDETDRLRVQGYSVKLIFLDCDIRVLVNRYKETRRIHPLVTVRNLTTVEALELEKSLLAPLREKADYVIDTSTLTVPQLKDNLIALLSSARVDSIVVTCLSFGYKYGIPAEADLIYDVRCFPNP